MVIEEAGEPPGMAVEPVPPPGGAAEHYRDLSSAVHRTLPYVVEEAGASVLASLRRAHFPDAGPSGCGRDVFRQRLGAIGINPIVFLVRIAAGVVVIGICGHQRVRREASCGDGPARDLDPIVGGAKPDGVLAEDSALGAVVKQQVRASRGDCRKGAEPCQSREFGDDPAFHAASLNHARASFSALASAGGRAEGRDASRARTGAGLSAARNPTLVATWNDISSKCSARARSSPASVVPRFRTRALRSVAAETPGT